MAAHAGSTGREKLTADTILDLLANRRRRYLLYALRGRDDPIELAELSREVAGWEHDQPPEAVEQSKYKSVYVSSVQCHVPKLDDAGVVDHDESAHTVVLADRFSQLEPYLEVIKNDEPEQTRVHDALTADSSDSFIGQLRSRLKA